MKEMSEKNSKALSLKQAALSTQFPSLAFPQKQVSGRIPKSSNRKLKNKFAQFVMLFLSRDWCFVFHVKAKI